VKEFPLRAEIFAVTTVETGDLRAFLAAWPLRYRTATIFG
jgi:hypothetical protein